MDRKLKKWITEQSQTMATYRVFSVARRRNRSPLSGHANDFFVLECPDWINVIPLTGNDEVVLIHQYRHGSDEVEWEIPGGCVDPGESPLAAAKRELAEETGYTASEWIELGRNSPNPALNNNLCYSFLAKGAVKTAEQNLDSSEEIAVTTVPLSRIPEMIRSGQIRHSLVITAFYFLDHLK